MIIKYFYRIVSVLFLLLFFSGCDSRIRVACIGDSITYGSGIKDKTKNYPSVLGALLGEEYDVRNFGVDGSTNLRKGNQPYVNEKKYKKALRFNPDIVVINLGTNDSKMRNWDFLSDDYEEDLAELVKSFRSLPSHPDIYLCFPTKVYKTRYSIRDSVIKNHIIPKIEKVAKIQNCHIVDTYNATCGMPQYFPDNIHPDEGGAKVIAETVYKEIISNANQ